MFLARCVEVCVGASVTKDLQCEKIRARCRLKDVYINILQLALYLSSTSTSFILLFERKT
jgi:hypothetical protein